MKTLAKVLAWIVGLSFVVVLGLLGHGIWTAPDLSTEAKLIIILFGVMIFTGIGWAAITELS